MTSISAHTAQRLLAAKQGYLEGDALRRRGDGVARIQAALMMDQAVETALKVVLSVRGGYQGGSIHFKPLVKKVELWVSSCTQFLPHRTARNAAQHEGLPPSPAELEAMSATARVVLKDAFLACGAELEVLTMERFVVNTTTRELLRMAQDKGQPLAMRVQRLRWALIWVRHMAKHLFAAARGIETWETIEPISGFRGVTVNADDRGELTSTFLDALVTASLGFDVAEEIRVAQVISKAESGTATQADHAWLLDYVARHAYRLEASLPHSRDLSPNATDPTVEGAAFMAIRIPLPVEPER